MNPFTKLPVLLQISGFSHEQLQLSKHEKERTSFLKSKIENYKMVTQPTFVIFSKIEDDREVYVHALHVENLAEYDTHDKYFKESSHFYATFEMPISAERSKIYLQRLSSISDKFIYPLNDPF